MIWCLQLKKCIFYRTGSKWPPLRWWHTRIRRAKLSITLAHSFFGIAQIFSLMATLSSVMDCGLFSYTLSYNSYSNSRRLRLGNRWSWWWLCLELSHLVVIIAHLDSHLDVFQVPYRTCSAHQCNASLRQWLPPRLSFQTKMVRLYHVLRWPLRPCISLNARASEAPCLGFLRPCIHRYCYWYVHRATSMLRRWTKHQQETQNTL